MKTPEISIILPTRKRTKTLINSLNSLLATAKDTSRIEILIAYDNDDEESKEFFANVWGDYIAQCEATSKIFETPRYGYLKLNRYVNFLGRNASGRWIMFWNDDALMLSDNWDETIVANNDWFGLLRMPCVNHHHPFALFPIIPREWINIFGCISPVSHSDWWLFHVNSVAGRVKNIPVDVYHDRADLSGGNNDETYAEQSYAADGKDPTNPDDYAHPDRQKELVDWINILKEITKIKD
jgi:glycosyltransferase involved in cell wall biosynthesis